ncbi:hypothetical protein BCR33DRAFT_712848 [Rhizoclosmatium globosum]|uniref:Uncharacterized protein n=1 Tax=Rhizoclosmatium globosum TaxID=329046 RepID=A0A1Y2CUZ3_9FUNG|nr:hypothetical protein BCR33DRAFT_712848 [Rhizoclosmatium globosum]|eukprot:ORY50879.1 hypothetical protein BCR33DRAFT_712848 [Rhizoclosmatium globosum]
MSFARAFAGYTNFVKKNPLGSQCLVAGLLWSAGDILSQSITKRHERIHAATVAPHEKHDSSIDWKRVMIMSSYGFFVAGPLYTFWYKTLDKVVEPLLVRAFKRSGKDVLGISKTQMVWNVAIAKVAADNFVFEPPYLSMFFLSTHTMSGTPFPEAVAHLKADFWPTYVTDILIWTPIQFINFRFVPVHFQPQFVNAFNIGWNAFLSYMKHEGSHYHAKPVLPVQ